MSSLEDLARELGISVEELEAAAAKAAKKQSAAIEKARTEDIEPRKRWNDADAAERWLEEEAELLDGVHGLGGQTAGGIFGDHAIATSVYDPSSLQRGEARAERRVTLEVLGKLSQELTESRETNRKLLEELARGRLPEGRRRRLR